MARARRQLDRFPRERRDRRLGPLGLVAIAVGFNLWVLRAEILPVLNLSDSAVHLSMVRWALDRMQEGHLPFDGWYPYLGLGSSLFHHYQSLPHILTGALSTIAWYRSARSFAWSSRPPDGSSCVKYTTTSCSFGSTQ